MPLLLGIGAVCAVHCRDVLVAQGFTWKGARPPLRTSAHRSAWARHMRRTSLPHVDVHGRARRIHVVLAQARRLREDPRPPVRTAHTGPPCTAHKPERKRHAPLTPRGPLPHLDAAVAVGRLERVLRQRAQLPDLAL